MRVLQVWKRTVDLRMLGRPAQLVSEVKHATRTILFQAETPGKCGYVAKVRKRPARRNLFQMASSDCNGTSVLPSTWSSGRLLREKNWCYNYWCLSKLHVFFFFLTPLDIRDFAAWVTVPCIWVTMSTSRAPSKSGSRSPIFSIASHKTDKRWISIFRAGWKLGLPFCDGK